MLKGVLNETPIHVILFRRFFVIAQPRRWPSGQTIAGARAKTLPSVVVILSALLLLDSA